MSDGLVHFHDQLRAVWKARDKDNPFVRGLLRVNGNGSDNRITVTERWFTLLGHAFFCCVSRDATDYNGMLLTDVFSPVITRVDEKTLKAFSTTDRDMRQQVLIASSWFAIRLTPILWVDKGPLYGKLIDLG